MMTDYEYEQSVEQFARDSYTESQNEKRAIAITKKESRMQQLLDELTNDEQSTTKTHNENNLSDESDIKINYEDLLTALHNKGRVSGYSNIVDCKNIYTDIVQNISLDDFQNAKTTIFTYRVNPDVSMFTIGDVMEKLHDEYLTNSCEVLFEITTKIDLPVEMVGYTILLTGIKEI